MKLRSISVSNVRSFLETQTLTLPENISIIVGPNGGGKTNLLDCVTHVLRKVLMPQHDGSVSSTTGKLQLNSPMISQHLLEKNFSGTDADQIIDVTVEATDIDVTNISAMRRDLPSWLRKHDLSQTYNLTGALNWSESNVSAGQLIKFSIVNGVLVTSTSDQFQKYLQYFQLDRLLRNIEDEAPLTTPTLSLSVTRTSGEFQAVITLSQVSIPQMRQAINGSDMPISGPRGYVSLAIGILAQKLRSLEPIHGTGAFDVLCREVNIVKFTNSLKSIGYEWSIFCVDIDNNSYTLKLKKQGAEFNLANASSGEKELITILLSIYILNVHDALVIVDEPELHLHPRWQKSLYRLFESLAKETGNQFLLATHSPTFISPSSIQNVSRVYSEKQKSRIVDINSAGLPSTKHLFEAINSQNNERMFFSDIVVLVEGPSDRMFFERLHAIRSLATSSGGATVEFISVGGKTMFEKYAAILDAWKVRHVRIADLDYLQEIGTPQLKALFKPDAKKMCNSVSDSTSRDGQSIIDMIEKSIAAGAWVGDANEWERIKARRSKLTVSPSDDENELFAEFVQKKALEGIFVLSYGSLEAYLPTGMMTKDIDGLIHLINSNEFISNLPSPQCNEIFQIVDTIEEMRLKM